MILIIQLKKPVSARVPADLPVRVRVWLPAPVKVLTTLLRSGTLPILAEITCAMLSPATTEWPKFYLSWIECNHFVSNNRRPETRVAASALFALDFSMARLVGVLNQWLLANNEAHGEDNSLTQPSKMFIVFFYNGWKKIYLLDKWIRRDHERKHVTELFVLDIPFIKCEHLIP
jgi:hypothetical protein